MTQYLTKLLTSITSMPAKGKYLEQLDIDMNNKYVSKLGLNSPENVLAETNCQCFRNKF